MKGVFIFLIVSLQYVYGHCASMVRHIVVAGINHMNNYYYSSRIYLLLQSIQTPLNIIKKIFFKIINIKSIMKGNKETLFF